MDESYGFDIAVILVENLSYIPFRIYFSLLKKTASNEFPDIILSSDENSCSV